MGATDTATTGPPVLRRSSYAANPQVGARGKRAQQRIVDAALQVFGEVGYHDCGIQRITEVSGCSRAAFYQYFSSKDDVFRHLARDAGAAVTASTAQVGPITADEAGREQLQGWLDRYAAIYDRYEPVVMAFPAASGTDATLISEAGRLAKRTVASVTGHVQGSPLGEAELTDTVRTLIGSVTRANRFAELLDGAAVPGRGITRKRLNRALADIAHRAIFGVDPGVNVHTPSRRRRVVLAVEGFDTEPVPAPDPSLGPAARRTRQHLLDAALDVFIELGYHRTRVADIVAAAEMSHGVFYRYFDNKEHIFEVLAREASQQMWGPMDRLPEQARNATVDDGDGTLIDPAALRTWLRTYADQQADSATIIAMWVEALARDPELGPVSVAAVERSRGRFAEVLAGRGFGDVDAEAVVLLVLVDDMTSQPVTPSRLETYARVIERGLLQGPRH